MIDRTNKVLIGKDIARTGAIVAGANVVTISANIADGEIVVLDKNKNVLDTSATIGTTDHIFICQGVAETFDYSNEAGTLVTGARKILYSDAIYGAYVSSYIGKLFEAKTQQTSSLVLTGLTPVEGMEYLVRLVYKDINEHPGQFTQTYRHIATAADATLDTFGNNIAAKINAHSGRRVNATYTTATDTLQLEARPIPECTTSLQDIDDLSMVEFEVFFQYVNAGGYWNTWETADTTITTTPANYGSGNWEQIRDIEKANKAYLGNTNKTQFPVQEKAWCTQAGVEYDMIIIEHKTPYRAPNNQGYETTPKTTIIALPDGAAQGAEILAALNPWMASLPGTFANVTL